MKNMGWKAVPILLFIVLIFFFWRGLSLDPQHLPSVQIGKAIPAFDLPQLQHPERSFSSSQLPSKVLLINVWASWCNACVEEQSVLTQLAKEGVLIYGINYKDRASDALRWLELWGNPYRLIGQDIQGKSAIDLGVYGAPETFVIDKKGIIRYRLAGIMTEALWLNEIRPLMRRLEHS